MNKYAKIIIDITNEAVSKPFIYKIPSELENEITIGAKVLVPFGNGNKIREGFVISIVCEEEIDYNKNLIKSIDSLAKNKISITEILIKMAIFMSKEYLTPLSVCLKTVLPVKKVIRKNSRQEDVLEKYELESDFFLHEKHNLNLEQEKVVNEILSDVERTNKEVNNSINNTHLIFGITGSGKTEVYMELIDKVIKNKKKVIVLIPEISLTYQTVIRLSNRFKGRVAIIHSKMSDGEKYIQYNKCINGDIDILVGPRSAIFAPFEDLGLIIIDEEHDHSYVSETSPKYNTKDLAMFRIKEQNATLVLGSATPSLKTYFEAQNGKIKLHKLTKRANEKSSLAKTYTVDLREDFKNKNKSVFSSKLYELIVEKLEKKEQIMLFMNRRGYSNFLNCRSCGNTIKCPHCSISLTVHKDSTLKCHYCGYEIKEPIVCPECGSPHIGPLGMGTEKLETLTKKAFPKARVDRMDADTVIKKGSMDKIIQKFRNKKIDILIGTQMIVKGHDFPNVTLVGIMAADMSLYIPSYKSSENTFQLLTQCAGRSGRALSGDVVIQTYEPEHYCIKCSADQNYEKFYEEEMGFRKLLNYPPFTNMLAFTLLSKDEMILSDACKSLHTFAKTSFEEIEIYGPQKASVYKIKDVYRKVFYIKCNDYEKIKLIRNNLVEFIKKNKYNEAVRCSFEIE